LSYFVVKCVEICASDGFKHTACAVGATPECQSVVGINRAPEKSKIILAGRKVKSNRAAVGALDASGKVGGGVWAIVYRPEVEVIIT
jgi:hypothetical protein